MVVNFFIRFVRLKFEKFLLSKKLFILFFIIFLVLLIFVVIIGILYDIVFMIEIGRFFDLFVFINKLKFLFV